jgi:hypothetical protein
MGFACSTAAGRLTSCCCRRVAGCCLTGCWASSSGWWVAACSLVTSRVRDSGCDVTLQLGSSKHAHVCSWAALPLARILVTSMSSTVVWFVCYLVVRAFACKQLLLDTAAWPLYPWWLALAQSLRAGLRVGHAVLGVLKSNAHCSGRP